MTTSDIALLRRRIEALEHSPYGRQDCFKERLETMRKRLAQVETRTHEDTHAQSHTQG